MVSIFIRTILIYIILNIMLKVMGKRQIGELEVNELVSTLLISEVAAIPISDTNISLIPSIIPIVFISATEVLISVIKNKSERLKRVIEGEPVYIIYKGSLRQKTLAENRISINEVLTEMRTQGIGDISEIEYGILEQNGKVSFLKKTDGNLSHTLIIDTKYNQSDHSSLPFTKEWTKARLDERGLREEDVFLMTVSDDGVINIIKKEDDT